MSDSSVIQVVRIRGVRMTGGLAMPNRALQLTPFFGVSLLHGTTNPTLAPIHAWNALMCAHEIKAMKSGP